jgi:uncharacterized protein (TIRG00374 family)
MRKFIFAVLLMLAVFLVIGSQAELTSIAATLKRGDWRFLLLGLFVEGAWLVTIAAMFRAIYRAIGIEEKIETLVFIVGASNFTNIVAPSGGMSGLAVFVAEAKRRNYSPARTAVSGALYVLFDYTGFLCVLAVGIIVLIRRNDLSWAVITASIIMTAMASARPLAWMTRLVNRIFWPFIHHEYLSENRARSFAHDASEGLVELKLQPSNMLLPAGLALLNKTFYILILTLMFLAFEVPISIGTVIAGFSICYLFVIVSPTPAGIGIVEGGLTIALSSMYIPLQDAAVITLSYRAITFWIPLLFGMISFRVLEHIGIKKAPENA